MVEKSDVLLLSSVCDAGSQEHGETERNAVEQCQFCWNVFTLSDLVSHVPSCPARSSSDRDVRQQ